MPNFQQEQGPATETTEEMGAAGMKRTNYWKH